MPALTSDQRATIRLYTGYANRFRDNNTDARSVQAALDTLDALTASGDTSIYRQITNPSPTADAAGPGLLALLDLIEVKIRSLYSLLGVDKAGGIGLSKRAQLGALRSEGRRLVGRLASLLGVDVLSDAFSGASAARGDNYMREG